MAGDRYVTGDPRAAIVALLAAARRRGPLAAGTSVIAIDGPSGAGKSTFAMRLVTALVDLTGSEPVLVHMDDLYPGWDGLDEAIPLLTERVLAPLARRQRASFRRYDWGQRRFAEEHVIPAVPWLVVEGVGCGARACTPYLSALAWVDAPTEQRMRRGMDRDGDAYRPHWDRWARQEHRLFTVEGTMSRADVLLDSGDNAGNNGSVDSGPTAVPPPVTGRSGDALQQAIVEMTHALGEDVQIHVDSAVTILTRRTPFARISPATEGGVLLDLSFPHGAPHDVRLAPTSGFAPWRWRVCVEASALDADLIVLEGLIETAYAQNG
ncbi:hypothetical protein KEM60_02284 [Austwickia sp. TVS 96-490-7B]|uniref:hypothetical protein n=1 Tax=Austwickia sp. TVS 96-490-7B TaxID=2830843 RepID=UPI001C5981BD|nr:hypothetical protein [Austwickia sp. TVS 96-490-7B]MBW3086073.1 hypothetical protein [Austwickia sp. TVS 96-490-7B]